MGRVIPYLEWAVVAGLTAWTAAFVLAEAVPLPDRLDAEDSTVVEWSDGRAAHVFLSKDDRWRIPVDLSRIDSDYTRALVALEDERYWWHPGVDPLAVLRAAYSNATEGRVVSGASTITMQLVRLLEPRPRTLRSKLVESLRAIQLEMRLSKREILEAYLSYVPYGRNVEGVTTASHLYFDKAPDALSGDEIATLLAVPQDPSRRHPDAENRGRLRRARNAIAGRLVDADALPREAGGRPIGRSALVEQIERTSVPDELGTLPREIPHAARWLRKKGPDERRIETTLDRNTQRTAEDLLRTRRARLQGQEIHNAAVVVAEHQTGAVHALIGNFDFDDRPHAGQIPGFDVPRSTGSLLKPFIYASAIDRGLAAPSHLVVDVPTTFGGYRPRNFRSSYRGLVELEEALSQSLNIPFVELLSEIGLKSFLNDLQRFGVQQFYRPADEFGLSVAVGGMELTPLDVAALYALLARDGVPAQLHATPFDSKKTGAEDGKLVDGAAWLTRRALRKRDRPDFPARKRSSNVPTGIHWKTGTSARNRDAWSAGSGPRYTAVVWAGNFDTARSPALVGARTAGPILFDILEALEDRGDSEDPEAPESLVDVEVCALSGHRPTEACPNRQTVRMPESSVATETCPYHVERDVDPKTGLALGPSCRSEFDSTTKSFVQIPARASRWLDGRLGTLARPPKYRTDCRPSARGASPAVENPPPNRDLVLIPGMDRSDQQVPLEARAPNHGATLHWFVDGRFLGTVDSGERLWWTPRPGRHDIVVMDESGRSDRRQLEVRASR